MKYKNYFKLLFINIILYISSLVQQFISLIFVFFTLKLFYLKNFIIHYSIILFLFSIFSIFLINKLYCKEKYYNKKEKNNKKEIIIFICFAIIIFFLEYIELYIKFSDSYNQSELNSFIIMLKSKFSCELKFLIKALTYGVFLEEFFFRKLYFDSIMKYKIRVNIHYIIILNVILFRLYHFNRDGISIQFILSLILYIICYLKFLNLKICIFIHILWNSKALFFGYLNSYNPFIYEMAKLSMNKNFQIIFEGISIIFLIIFYLYYAKDLKNWSDNIIVDRKMKNKNINTSNKSYVVKVINGFIKNKVMLYKKANK